METGIELIRLNRENKNLYGFVCFHFKGEERISNGWCFREVEFPNESGAGNSKRVIFPPEEVVVLSNDKSSKVNLWPGFKILQAGSDIDPMLLLSGRIGWNQTRADVKAFVDRSRSGNFLAVVEKDYSSISLGSGLAFSVNDKLIWIGMILVHPELRRQGIANSLMKRCLHYSRVENKHEIVGLDATPAGKQVYTSLGFKESFHIWRCTASTNIISPINDSLPAERMDSPDDCYEYLKSRKLIDKYPLLKMLHELNGDGCFKNISHGKMNGFVMSRPGRLKPYIGPLFADDDKTANKLLVKALKHWGDLGFTQVFIDVPEIHLKTISKNNAAAQHPKGSGIETFSDCLNPEREFIRMYQYLNEGEKASLLGKLREQNSEDKANDKWENIFTETEKQSYATKCYMQFEEKEILPYLFAIAGPEIS